MLLMSSKKFSMAAGVLGGCFFGGCILGGCIFEAKVFAGFCFSDTVFFAINMNLLCKLFFFWVAATSVHWTEILIHHCEP
jgi:hypothetical protein